MSGFDIAAEVAAGIAEAGAELGNGSPLEGILLRPASGGRPDYSRPLAEQTGREPAEHPCTVLQSSYSARDRNGGNIATGDVKLIVSTEGLTIVPSNSDKIKVSGNTYSIIDVTASAPGGVVVMWTLQARRA